MEHPASDVPDETRILGQRDEKVGEEQAALGMLPAHERLDAGHRAGPHRDLRLIEQAQLVRVERAADAGVNVPADFIANTEESTDPAVNDKGFGISVSADSARQTSVPPTRLAA